MFVDRVEFEVSAGRGGDGCVSFRRERFIPRGGPDGGDGGHGGSIVIVARAGVNSLDALAPRKTWAAEKGRHGSGKNRRGRNGADRLLEVPAGTLVYDAETRILLKDLVDIDEPFIAAQGGKGGKGNWRFKSATNQVPREHTPGEEGQQRRLMLELKVIADVGLVGRPNAGKSTLLSRMSKARPRIADYPFTTKTPTLGRIQVDWNRSFVMADIPGLIEGAHKGVGLGHEFLRHIERAGILVHLVEPMPIDETDPIDNYRAIRHELVEYNPELADRPEVVAITKAELPGADEIRRRLTDEIGREVLLISAVTGQGLDQLMQRILLALSPPES